MHMAFLDPQSFLDLAGKFLAFSLPLSFVAPFIGGEAAILILAFLAGQGFLPIGHVIAGSFLGMVALDSFWFFVPRSSWAKRFQNRMSVWTQYQKLKKWLESVSGHNDVAILFLSKVLVGTRILVLAYLSVRRITYGKFIAYNSIATFLWAVALGYLGWFAGLGYYNLFRAYEDITSAILYIAAAAGAFYGLLWLLRTWIMQK